MNSIAQQKQYGHIILLNGSSASGKTSVQKAIQAQSDTFYITVGIDNFFDALIPAPDLTDFEKTKTLVQTTKTGELIRSITLQKDDAGNVMVPLVFGPAGNRIINGMHQAIAAYAQCGNNIIVDYILYDPHWITYLKDALCNCVVYTVGFKLPLDVVEEREKARATSPVGHARSHYNNVHAGFNYDIEISDPSLSAEQIAEQVVHFVQSKKKLPGFSIL